MNSEVKPYLCGGINGLSDEQCKSWREDLKKHYPRAIDPMDRDYRGKERGSCREIVELDKMDIRNADFLICYAPQPSWGMAMEMHYAWSLGKILVTIIPGYPNSLSSVSISPWVEYHSTVIVRSVECAIAWIDEKLLARL